MLTIQVSVNDLCLYVSLQQGQVQVLPRWLGHESGEGHERSITSAGLTNQTAAQERNGLHRTLEGERNESLVVRKVDEKTRERQMIFIIIPV